VGVKAFPVSADEAARLATLHQRCFKQSWTAAEFASLMNNPAVIGLVFTEDERDIGLTLLQTIGSETEILTFGILPERRGLGLGYGLLQAICDLLLASDKHNVFLEVSENNKPAINLYLGFGFKQISVRPRYYDDGSDALIYRLALPQ